MIRKGLLVGALCCASALSVIHTASAQNIVRRPVTGEELLNGYLIEKAPPGSIINIGWTGLNGLTLPDPGSVIGPFVVGPSGQIKVPVPLTLGADDVVDVIQETTAPNQAANSLHIEALGRSGADLTVTRFSTAVWEINGFNTPLPIPDIFADTNNDSVLDSGDLLYTAVDLYAYTAGGAPSFSIGDTVSIINGTSAAFPGMVFGLAPLTLDAASPNGFDNPSPATVTGTILTEHTPVVVAPEPTSLALCSAGILAGLFGGARRRLRAAR